MADENDPADAGGPNARDPNTEKELRKARNDASRYREEAERHSETITRLQTDLKAEQKVADGLRGKLKQTENDYTAKLEEREKREEELRQTHRAELAEREAKEADLVARHKAEVEGFSTKEREAKSQFEEAQSKSKGERDDLVMRYELSKAAIKNGCLNEGDLVQLLDRSSLKFDKDGKLTGVEELIGSAKAEKPYLFKQPEAPVVPDSSSNPRRAPDNDSKPKLATEMTPEDYRIARAALTQRTFN